MGDQGNDSGAPIILTGTGPFAPPDDFLEELLGAARVGIDLRIVSTTASLNTLSSAKPAKALDPETFTVLEYLIDSALARLSGDGQFLSGIARKLGEAGFEQAIARAGLKDEQALATVREKASQAGGLVPLLERLLGNSTGTFSTERARMKSAFNSFRNANLKEQSELPQGDFAAAAVDCGVAAGLVIIGATHLLTSPFTTDLGVTELEIGISMAQHC